MVEGGSVISQPLVPRSPHALLPLFPRFLARRRRGFTGIEALLAESGLSRPALFLLVGAAQGSPAGSTVAELRPGAPYATRDPHLPWLVEATAGGYLTLEGDRYYLTAAGTAVVARLEREATAYLAALQPLPRAELACLAEQLGAIAAALPAGKQSDARLDGSRRLVALAPEHADAPLVRIERAIAELWRARDDAHIAAWRAAWFPGPALDVLTRLWQGEVETLPALHQALAATQGPADVDAVLDELVEQGYVAWQGDTLQPTRAGYGVREEIEAETDRYYFEQWPALDPTTVAWLHEALDRLIDALPDSPRS